MLNDQELAQLIWREIDEGLGYDHDVLAEKRSQALDYYLGENFPVVDGRSDIISYDVADVVHAILSESDQLYKSSQIEFVSANEEDEKQAQLETDAVRAVIDQNDAWSILSAATHDALLIGNGWIKVWVEESEDVVREQYTGIDDIALYQIMKPTAEQQTVEITDQEEVDGKLNVSIKRTTQDNKLTVEAIAPEQVVFSQSYSQLEFQQIRFFSERKLYTESELKDLGATEEQIEQTPNHTDDWWVAVNARRGQYAEDTDDELGGKQDAAHLKEVFDCYFLVDLEENGTLERRHILMGGREIFENEPADWIPFSTGSPVPLPHRIQGQGMFELMGQIQTGKTVILRNYLDSLELANWTRTAYWEGEVNPDDLEQSRTDGTVACKRPPGEVLMPMPTNPVGAEAIAGLNYLDSVREQRGGATIELAESQAQVVKSSSMAAAGVEARAEQASAWYIRNLANSLLKGMFYLVHRTLREGRLGTINAKRRGKWEQVDPTSWPDRKHCRVDVGLTSIERRNRKADYGVLITHQEGLMQAGGEGVIVDKDKVYNSMCDWIRSAELGPPEEYLIDPSSEQSQQRQQQISQQQQQQGQQLQQLQAQMQQFEKWKHETELEYKYFDTKLDNETDRIKAGIDAEIDEAKITTDAVVALSNDTSRESAGNSENGAA